jgi:hypothetical protein
MPIVANKHQLPLLWKFLLSVFVEIPSSVVMEKCRSIISVFSQFNGRGVIIAWDNKDKVLFSISGNPEANIYT